MLTGDVLLHSAGSKISATLTQCGRTETQAMICKLSAVNYCISGAAACLCTLITKLIVEVTEVHFKIRPNITHRHT